MADEAGTSKKRKAAGPPGGAAAAGAGAAGPFDIEAAKAAFDALWAAAPLRKRGPLRDHIYAIIVGSDGADDGQDPYEVEESDATRVAALGKLREIAVELRSEVVDVSGGAPGEVNLYPPDGRPSAFAGCTEENSTFVDSFLYDDDAVDDLYAADPPQVSRSFCPDPTKPKDCRPL